VAWIAGRMRAYLAGDRPSLAVATSTLRLVYLTLFALQVIVALAVGFGVAAMLPRRPAPSDPFAIVLLLVAALHLPLAWLLARAAARSGGREAALSSTVLSAVLSSVPAWFAALMLISGQRPIYLWLVMSLVSLAYALGFAATGRAADAASRDRRAADAAEASNP
jgi:hypothetical protein